MPSANHHSKEGNLAKSPHRRGLRRLIIALSAVALFGLAFWLVWNLAGVPLVAVPALTYWQALGAVLLTALLLGSGRVLLGRHRVRRPAKPSKACLMFVDPMPFWRGDA